MPRIGEDLGRRPAFDDFSIAHHMDRVGDPADDSQVVADEDHRHAEALFEFCEEIEDFSGNRHVESRRRLIRDQQIRVAGDRHRNRDALALAAGQFMRICMQPASRLGNAGEVQKFLRPCICRAARQTGFQTQDRANLGAHRKQGIEGRHGLLEHHGDTPAKQRIEPFLGKREKLHALEEHRTRCVCVAGQKSQRRKHGLAFAGPGFAHYRRRFTTSHRQA